jgi:hypothetical protein
MLILDLSLKVEVLDAHYAGVLKLPLVDSLMELPAECTCRVVAF